MNAVTQATVTAIDLLEKVDKFYRDSWSDLLWAVGGAIAIAGVLIPTLLAYLQRKSAQDEYNRMREFYEQKYIDQRDEFRNEVAEAHSQLSTLSANIAGQYQKVTELMQTVDKLLETATEHEYRLKKQEASSLIVAAELDFKSSDYYEAIKGTSQALEILLEAENQEPKLVSNAAIILASALRSLKPPDPTEQDQYYQKDFLNKAEVFNNHKIEALCDRLARLQYGKEANQLKDGILFARRNLEMPTP